MFTGGKNMKIISICNQKGGVGKTTVCINLSAALAKLGRKVLTVDLDGQWNLTNTIQTAEHQNRSIADLIYCEASCVAYDPAQYVFHNDNKDLDYIPASNMLASAPAILANSDDSSMILSRILHRDFFQKYDFILIDCRPSLDLLTVNALTAANQVTIPVEPEGYAVDGLTDLWASITRIKKTVNPALTVNGILITKADPRRKLTHSLEQQLRDTFQDKVYRTVLPMLTDAPNAASRHQSTVSMKGSRLGGLFMELAKEVVERCK
jgi:chromosome partitioning protein